MKEISELPKGAIAEKLLAEINLHEKDYYGKNSELLAREVAGISSKGLRRLFESLGRLEELDEALVKGREAVHRKLIKEHYVTGDSFSELKRKTKEAYPATDISLRFVKIALVKYLNNEPSKMPDCKTCGAKHNCSYSSSLFCSEECARASSSLKDKSKLGSYKIKQTDKARTYYKNLKG